MGNKMTTGEFLNNYEYKVTKRLVKKEYPFIIDLIPTERFEQYDFLKFVYAVVDPYKMMELYPKLSPLYKYINYSMNIEVNGVEYIYGVTLKSFLDDDKANTAEALKIGFHIDNIISSIHKSPAIPDDMRIQYGEIEVSGYIIPKSLLRQSVNSK